MKDVGTCWISNFTSPHGIFFWLILSTSTKFLNNKSATNEPGKVKPAKKTDKLPIFSSFSQKISEIKNNI